MFADKAIYLQANEIWPTQALRESSLWLHSEG